jgi:hypothetical protein
MGFPGAGGFILHCTLLLKAAGQEKFGLPVRVCRARARKWAKFAG